MPRLQPFQDDLPIPALVRPLQTQSGQHLLSLSARSHQVQLHNSLPSTRLWSYQLEKGHVVHPGSGNSYLGPTIESKRAQEVSVAWKNDIPATSLLPYEVIKVPNPDAGATLPVPENEPGRDGALSDADDPQRVKLRSLRATLVTHLHGARVPADSDGWPDNTTLSGHAAHYTYPNDQAATMLWYHDHCMHVTRLNVYAGLAGAWLVRDDEERALGLPHGEWEIPLVIQDRNLDLDAQGYFTGALLHKTEVSDGPAEFFGPYTLVNGKIWPRAGVEPRLYRLRLLNGSNARTYRLLFLDDQGQSINPACWQIGCDQGLMANKVPLSTDGLVLAPSERVDLLVDFAAHAGQQVYLWNTADAPFGDDPHNLPTPQNVQDEWQALQDDPLASADSVNPDNYDNAINRRLFPQVMRFDVAARADGALFQAPPDPLRELPAPAFTPQTPVRLMALVEVPAPSSPIDATSMLVFYEFVSVADMAPPPCTDVVTITYWHPGQEASVTGQFWKAAQQFYDQINWRVHLDSTELWYIVNLSPDTHPVHVHLVDMSVTERFDVTWNGRAEVFDPSMDKLTQIIATNPKPLDPSAQGPKDTVRVNPGEMVGVAIKFSPFTGRYMYHCHILEHEDHDMMRPFVVVPAWVPHHDD